MGLMSVLALACLARDQTFSSASRRPLDDVGDGNILAATWDDESQQLFQGPVRT